MKKISIDQLGSLSIPQLKQVNHKLKVQVVANQARNNQRLINLADLQSMEKNSVSEIKNSLFRNSIQEINTVLWPFFFQSEVKFVEAGNEVNSKIQISAEAAYVVTEMQRVIYEYDTVTGTLTYIDPENFTQQAKDLKFAMNDLSSERSLTDKSISLESLGHCQKPTELYKSPFYLNPNQSMEFRFSAEGNKSYFTSVLFKGYRIRIQDASRMNIPTVTL
jgi:hypothetical protein